MCHTRVRVRGLQKPPAAIPIRAYFAEGSAHSRVGKHVQKGKSYERNGMCCCGLDNMTFILWEFLR